MAGEDWSRRTLWKERAATTTTPGHVTPEVRQKENDEEVDRDSSCLQALPTAP